MPTMKSIADFFSSDVGVDARLQLVCMSDDPVYNTRATYTSDQSMYPNNLVPFVDKHMRYLSTHPQVEMQTYIANLRLMTRSRL